MYRKISGHYIVSDRNTVIKNGIITIDKSGKILDVKSAGNNMKEISGMEFYNGVLVPGFVNAHCHLELSHLKGKINKHTGLHGFICDIKKMREKSDCEIKKKAQQANKEMIRNGVVAVGDIVNTPQSLEIKLKSDIKYHTFVELFSTNSNTVHNVFEKGKNLENLFKQAGLPVSITAHSPYSVIPKLFNLITSHLSQSESIISIHNQECLSENELYINKTGALYEMFKSQNIDLQDIPKTGKSSLISILSKLNPVTSTILVHNTFSSQRDVEFASNYLNNLYWCLCPNANLYIENTLPNVNIFRSKQQKICIGTDSLASNSKLSVLDELKVIANAFPKIPFEELISWATINGAESLNMDDNLGSFEINKQPGINLIENINLNDLKLTTESNVKKIV